MTARPLEYTTVYLYLDCCAQKKSIQKCCLEVVVLYSVIGGYMNNMFAAYLGKKLLSFSFYLRSQEYCSYATEDASFTVSIVVCCT